MYGGLAKSQVNVTRTVPKRPENEHKTRIKYLIPTETQEYHILTVSLFDYNLIKDWHSLCAEWLYVLGQSKLADKSENVISMRYI